MKKLIWLDDQRNPLSKEMDWLQYSPIGRDIEIIWLKNYRGFTSWITENAKWLVDYCLDNKLELPLYNIQSSNPAGKENIDKLLKNYIKYDKNIRRNG